jgi:hypothetical protein
MNPYRITIRLEEEPRSVELEIAAPLGTRTIEPLDEVLERSGVRAIGKVVFDTSRYTVFLAKLVEGNRRPLEAERIGATLDTIRRSLSANVRERSLAA